jgi:kumamolisin
MATIKSLPLPDSARPHLPNSQFIRAVEPSKQIGFTLFIRPKSGAPALPDLAYWQRTPLSERKFLSSREFAETYGSSVADLAATTTTLRGHSMTVKDQHLGAGTVTAEATAAQIKSLFGVQLGHYKAPTPAAKLLGRRSNMHCTLPETEIYHGYKGELSLPAHLDGVVTHVAGLDSRSIAAPAGFTGDPTNSNRLPVTDIAGLYNFPTNIDASDQTIGIFNGGGADSSGNSTSNYSLMDISKYFGQQTAGFQAVPNVVPISLTIGTNSPYVNDPTNPTMEITQDIMTSSTIAQGCTVNVYFSDISEQGWIVFLNRILFPQGAEKMPNVVSCSWIMYDEAGYGSAFSFLFQRLAAVGISFFAAVGDWGSSDNVPGAEHVGYPASDPWVTAVGGTVAGNIQSGPPVTFDEYAWSDTNNPSSQFTFVGGGTTGGGMSTIFTTPDYQTAANITKFQDSNSVVKTGGRFTPDISGMVGYNNFILGGSDFNFIGTSCSCPLYAGLFASLRSALGTSFGFLNPTLYQLGTANATNGVFKDTKFGNNDPNLGATPDDPYFNTGPGYDPVTGWGSINGRNMESSLAKILFPPSMYVTVIKNSFGLTEVQGSAVQGNAEWSPTLLLTLDGFAPNDLTSAPLPTNPMGSDTTVAVGPAQYELKSQLSTVQRILFPISINFGPTSSQLKNHSPPGIFPSPGSGQIEYTLKFDLTLSSGQSLEALAPIYLLAGADPYFSNLAPNVKGEQWYLSQDLRVFTVCPGINPSPIADNSRTGLPTLTPNSNTDWESSPGYSYMKSLLKYFNSPGNADPFSLLPDQSSSLTEDSTVAPDQANPAGGSKFANYTFAIARVRSRGPTGSVPVKVFFRLFTSNHPQTWFLPDTSYYQSPPPLGLPEAPLPATDLTTIPFFATGNLQTNTDYTLGGANNKPISSTGDSYTYFGCFLDIYSGFYTLPKNGVPTAVSAFLEGGHQCLVAQIAFDDAPIENLNGILATPQNSDKLAQRNLQVSLSDNPGPADTHLIPQTFDVAPTKPPPRNPGQFMDLPDELMIDWGNTPIGSTAQIYWPSVVAADAITLARRLYPTHQLRTVAGDANTIEVTVPEGFTFVPIPFGKAPNIAGLVTIQLPEGIVQGQEFLLTVRRIATRSYEIEDVPRIEQPARFNAVRPNPPILAFNYRYTAGIFAIKIPVVVRREMLPIEQNTQAIIAWRLNQLSPSDRWYKVMQRYLSYINRRVSGLGGVGPVVPSPTGAPPGPGHHCHHHGGHHCHPCHHHDGSCECYGPSHVKSKEPDHDCGHRRRACGPHQPKPHPCHHHPQHLCDSCHSKEPSGCTCRPDYRLRHSCPHSGSHGTHHIDRGTISGIIHDRFGDFCGFRLSRDLAAGEAVFRHVEQRMFGLMSRLWSVRINVEVVSRSVTEGDPEVLEVVVCPPGSKGEAYMRGVGVQGGACGERG